MLSPVALFRFACGRFLAALADQFLLFAVPLLVYKTTGSVSKSGLAFFIEWAPRVLSLPVAGVLADRFGGPAVYIFVDGTRSLLCALGFVLLLNLPTGSFLILSVLVSLLAILNAQAFVALEASLPRYVGAGQLPKAQALLQGSEQTSQILGPALAAFCATLVSTQGLLLVCAGMFAVSFVNVLAMRVALAMAPSSNRSSSLFESLRTGVQTLRNTPVLFAMIGLTILVNLMIGVTLASSAALTTGVFSMPDHYFGLLYTLGGAVGVASFFALPRLTKRFPLVRLGTTAYATMCLGAVAIGLAPNYGQFAFGLALLLGSVGLFNVFIRTERVRHIPPEHLGKTMGLIVLLNQMPLPLSGLLVALFSEKLGAQRVILAVAGAAILTALILFPLISMKGDPREYSDPA
jgi:MFS family permease